MYFIGPSTLLVLFSFCECKHVCVCVCVCVGGQNLANFSLQETAAHKAAQAMLSLQQVLYLMCVYKCVLYSPQATSKRV